MSDVVDGLNEPQREAVLHGDGPLLVLAGAGSGKTRVLTRRVARLIGDGVPAHRILAITFTNRAAAELRERIADLVGRRLGRDVWASTFHAMCARFLRIEAAEAGYPRDFTIFDADDQLRLLRQCLSEADIDPKSLPPAAVRARISDAKNRLMTPEQVADDVIGFPDARIGGLYRRYQDGLAINGAVDFDDLLMISAQLLEGNAAVRARWQGRFSHVLVDEYQDTNHAQYRLVRALAAPENNVTVVGDDDQGIYSWRGADVRNILDFEHDFPDARRIALEQNYRSTGTILRAANAVVQRNPNRHSKRLWTAGEDGDPIRLLTCRDEYEEARAVAAEVERVLAAGGTLDDVAVFYRTNAQSRAIEDVLVRLGITHSVVGGPRFYERAEVRDLLAYLRAALNPADRVSLARALGAPRRGIGPAALARIERAAVAHDSEPARIIARPESVEGLNARQREAVGEVGALLAELRQMAAAGSPPELIVERAIRGSGLLSALEAEDTFEARGRIENLQEVARAAAEADVAGDDENPLATFLEAVALQADADLVEGATGSVTLMTIHNAKGLEFPSVVITGLEEGLFPHARSDSPDAEEEERRLFYVGLTRARRRLTLTHAETRAMYGGRDYRLPSRFLAELPPDCLDAPGPGGRRPAERRSEWAPAGERRAEQPSQAGGSPIDRRPPSGLAEGQRVVHASFGEGVVTAVEGRGDLVRVRFENDGVERRLMAGAAPMRKLEN